VHEFWSASYSCAQEQVGFTQVPAHGCRVALLRPVEEAPQWVGSTLHLVQGSAVAAWQATAEGVTMQLDAGRSLEGNVLLWLPQGHNPQLTVAENAVASLEVAGEELWRIDVQTGQEPARVVLEWE
jgi:hypothetical protein